MRYWLTNEFKYSVIMPVKWKFDRIRNWVRYRTYDRYHVIDTGLTPDYYSVDTQMLHVNFNILKEFVEVEQAWSKYCWSGEYKNAPWCERYIPFYRFVYPFRRPDLGVEHFEWAATLDDPILPLHERSESQAISAREVLALYKWWTQDRPARKEIEYLGHSDQGLGLMSSLDDDFDRDAEDYKAHIASMDDRNAQEEEWEKEDTEMLIRLIKIRGSLWT